MSIPTIAPESPDLHLVFNWDEGDLCLLTVYAFSEAESKPEIRVSIAYYRGFQKRPSLSPVAFGTRAIDPNLDLSNCSAAEAKAILVTPKTVVKEIEDSIAGKVSEAHFQECAFDPSLKAANPAAFTDGEDQVRSQSTGSKGWTPDQDSERPQPATDRDKIYGGLNPTNPGIHVVGPKPRGPREDAPWWVLDQDKFAEFLEHLRDEREPVKLIDSESGQRIPTESVLAVALDQIILREFYLLGSEDQDIFTDYGDEFAREQARQRRTQSVAAVKKRRQRLVHQGNAIYGETKPNVVPISQRQAPASKRRFGGLVGRFYENFLFD